jgi:hypothetical protein
VSVTTALPSPASVGARITPRINASLSENEPNRATATSPPSTIVSGRPTPSKRTGIEASRRSARRFTREESENSTTASVASASVRTVELVGPTVRSSSTGGPTRTPTATTTIAGVMGVLDKGRDTAATSSSVTPTIARPAPTASPLLLKVGETTLHAASMRLRRRLTARAEDHPADSRSSAVKATLAGPVGFPSPARRDPIKGGTFQGETRRKFDRDLKEGAVQLVRETGKWPRRRAISGLSSSSRKNGRIELRDSPAKRR